MKITIEVNGQEFSAKTQTDDVAISEIPDMIKGLLIAATYHPANVDGLFAEEYQWYNEERVFEPMEDGVGALSWPEDGYGIHPPPGSN